MSNLIHEELTYRIRGVLFEVHNELGPRLPEQFYQQAITHGLREPGITNETEKCFQVVYRNLPAGIYFIDHWLENGKVLLELKVAPKLLPIHQAQTISYLKLTHADLALLVNFGAISLQVKRLLNLTYEKTVTFDWRPPPLTKDLLYPELTSRLYEALHRVHFTLGPGFIHRVYRQAVMIELQYQGISYEHLKKIPIYYHNHYIDSQEAQVIKVEDKILLGVFAVGMIGEEMVMVMRARLKRLKMVMGLLANFHGEKLEVKGVSTAELGDS
jgi:GxxExxY protein